MIAVYAASDMSGEELLALAAEKQWGWKELPEIGKKKHGKPYFPAAPEAHFNLSHSGGLVFCAVGDGPVGVDVEGIQERESCHAARFFSPEEYRYFTENGGGEDSFLTLWTRKESLVKCTGRGLTLPVRDIAVPPPPVQRMGEWYLRSYAGAGWRAAVCAGELPPDKVCWIEEK